MRVRNILFVITISLLLTTCNEDDGRTASTYIVLNRVNNRANISIYDSKSKTLTEQLYTTDDISYFSAAAKSDDILYVLTFEGYPKLRKIDLKTGVQVKSKQIWDVWSDMYLNLSNDRIIVSRMVQDGYCIEVYDENLTLLDSAVRPNLVQVDGALVSHNKLFSIVGDGNKGYIHVLDLNTLTPVDSVELTSNLRLIPYKEGKFLGIKSGGYFIFNTESLTIEDPKETHIYSYEGVALNSSENILYYVQPLAQPSLYAYILRKVNILTGESTEVTEYGEPINGPLLYDSKAKVIVSGGGLKIFSRDGEVMDWVEEAPGGTWGIFVQ